MRWVLGLSMALLVLSAFPLGQGGNTLSRDDYDHPDPGLSPSFGQFPTHDEVLGRIEAVRQHPWVKVHELGVSQEGRPIRLLEITDPEPPMPASDRVVTFLFTQQHGNEPAGTPAALDLVDALLAGDDLKRTLRNQILLVLPMANPDGAIANQRHNAQDLDINRDHISLESPEARVLHHVLNEWDVHVAMDHHEYGGVGFGNPSPVRLYDYDLTTLFPNHGNVRQPTADWSRKLMYEGIWPRAEEAGFTANEYGEQTVAGVPVQQVAGGPDPGIMRNHLGLHHITGLLVETRVDAHPNPFHDAERRTALHRLVMEATLEFANEHAAELRQAKAASKQAALERPDAQYLEGTLQGPLAKAYRVPAQERLDELMAQHELPPGVLAQDYAVYDLQHDHQGHAAALLHPQSSRKVATGEATQPIEKPMEEPARVLEAKETPGFAAVAALAGSLLVGLRRRR